MNLHLPFVVPRRLRLVVVWVVLVGLTFGAALSLPSWAEETPRPPKPSGWSDGQPAATTADMLKVIDPLPFHLPGAIAERITTETAVFYFSPTCGHCQAAMPDVNALQGKAGIQWLGVAVGSASPEEIESFRQAYAVAFPIVIDTDRAFSRAVGARSTPSVYVFRPLPPDAPPSFETLLEAVPEGHSTVLLTQAYPPFPRGAGAVLLLRAHLDQPFADFQGYQGDMVCRGCHLQEARSAMLTHHSVALYTIYKREKIDDPECVRCHVTGMGEEGGYTMGDVSHPLASVQCEACHGPSGPHDGVPTNARESCVGCHDAEHSIAFSVEKGLPHIDHYRGNLLSDDALRERVAALADGTAEKPLLAFGDGPTVGADQCKSCHDAAHKWAKKDPHAAAMKHLDKSGADNPTCVGCHATQRAYGLGVQTDTITAFRTDEGVGCESCHGPGEAHIAAPSRSNIVGLGASCPECVVEAICTSCHTPEQDPGWSLSERLKAIQH